MTPIPIVIPTQALTATAIAIATPTQIVIRILTVIQIATAILILTAIQTLIATVTPITDLEVEQTLETTPVQVAAVDRLVDQRLVVTAEQLLDRLVVRVEQQAQLLGRPMTSHPVLVLAA
ncbi:hypothetical protein L3X07_13120 [Levilactobacillus brevis]|nr:hypothetical protein [Levilactobacillus brevis]